MSPLTSIGVEGTATESPGVEANNASNELQWCAPPRATPEVARITSGTLPLNIKRIFAAWFRISSIAPKAKSMKFKSTIGWQPYIAAPTPAATMAASEMGESFTRS